MGVFIKVQKDAAYFKRFIVKLRRRRECKTDYKARRRMIQQAKNKYNTPKYRFVVRITNRDVITQVVAARLKGDVVLAAAYSHELKQKYNVPVGLTNYAACYATGLLCARRLLSAIGLADKYQGVTTIDGKHFEIAAKDGERKPFKCVLDVGLARTTSGARVFAALKGAVDGGLLIPHSPARFSGFKDKKLDDGAHRKRLLGEHVAAYLKDVIAGGSAGNQFSKYVENKINPAKVSELWLATHKAIRADPKPAPKKAFTGKHEKRQTPKRTTAARINIRQQRKRALQKKAQANAPESESDEEA